MQRLSLLLRLWMLKIKAILIFISKKNYRFQLIKIVLTTASCQGQIKNFVSK